MDRHLTIRKRCGWRCILTMKDAEGRKFYHRVNPDGTIDSICLSCFLTVARADIGSDLEGPEAAHKCKNKEPFILSENLQSFRLR